MAEFFARAQPNCLHKPTFAKTIEVGPRCGNALVEPGEECDCGTVEVTFTDTQQLVWGFYVKKDIIFLGSQRKGR